MSRRVGAARRRGDHDGSGCLVAVRGHPDRVRGTDRCRRRRAGRRRWGGRREEAGSRVQQVPRVDEPKRKPRRTRSWRSSAAWRISESRCAPASPAQRGALESHGAVGGPECWRSATGICGTTTNAPFWHDASSLTPTPAPTAGLGRLSWPISPDYREPHRRSGARVPGAGGVAGGRSVGSVTPYGAAKVLTSKRSARVAGKAVRRKGGRSSASGGGDQLVARCRRRVRARRHRVTGTKTARAWLADFRGGMNRARVARCAGSRRKHRDADVEPDHVGATSRLWIGSAQA